MSEHAVDICVIEDDATERTLLMRRFERSGHSLVEGADGIEGLELIRRHQPRVVVCDVMLPRLSGIDVCARVRADSSLAGTYFIMVTAYDSQKRKRDALNVGADDYLIKPYDPDELEAKLRNGLRISRLQERLRHAALTDSLTGLWNHNQFRELLDHEFTRIRRYSGQVALLMIDLDHFKAVNDTYGHETGNQVLQQTARHLQHAVRDIDSVARYGGEEFAVVCPQTDLDAAAQIAERILATLPGAVRVAEHPELQVRASIGVAASGLATVHSAEDLITAADQALYTAKACGRAQVRRADEVGEVTAAPQLQAGEVDRLRKQVVVLSMQAKELCLQSVWALVQALEARDPLTARHSQNVRVYAQQLAQAAGWSEHMRAAVTNAAMLHDLGKIGVPDRVLQKPGRLSAAETTILRQVPLITCKILEPLRVFETETHIIRHLRERWDGGGYPDGLAGPAIPLGSRLLAVAETFDALTSDRVHRPGISLDEALQALRDEAGQHFDPDFVRLLTELVEQDRTTWESRLNAEQPALCRSSLTVDHL